MERYELGKKWNYGMRKEIKRSEIYGRKKKGEGND